MMRILASLLVVGAFIAGALAFQSRDRGEAASGAGIATEAPPATGSTGVTSSSAAADTIERQFPAGGRVDMDLSAGEYRIEASQEDRIRIHWTSDERRRARPVIRAEVRGAEATVVTDGPSRKHFRVRIELPRRTDLHVRLTAGDLALRGIEGNKDVELHAGELDLDVVRPEDYRRVEATVWAGELQAVPFNVIKEGLFRSFTWNGQGTYRFRAHLKAGELRMSSSAATLR
jgi:hypothetical protein